MASTLSLIHIFAVHSYEKQPYLLPSVVDGEGEGQEEPLPLPAEPAGLHGGEEVGLFLIGMDGEVAEAHPGEAGDGVGVGGRGLPGLAQDAVMAAVASLILEVRRLEGGELIVIGRPEEGEGLVVLMEGGVEGREAVEARCV